MKRLISIILSVAVASVFTACKDDYDGWLPDNPDKPHITEIISPTDIKIDAAGTPQTVTVALNDDWTITNIPYWLTVSPTSGKAGEKVTVNISAESNTKSVSERGAQLYVSTKFNTQYIGVIQFGVPESGIPYLSFSATGGQQTFRLFLHSDWEITNIPTWLRFSATKGYAEQEYTITVTAEENSSTSSRTTTCRLYRGNSNQYETLSAKQDAHYLKINGREYSSSFSFYSNTDIEKVTISSSAKWTAKATQPWIVLSQTEGLPGETILTISTKKASTTTSTSGQINFYIGDTYFNTIYTYIGY